MSSPSSPQRPERPLSPHLQVYKPQLTSVLSITHRVTGVGLSLGMLFLVAWLISLATGPDYYAFYIGIITHPVCQFVLCGLTWAFIYHLCCGIRHMLWDAGFFLSLEGVYSTGRVTLAVSTLLTLALWLKIFGYGAMQ